ncbi:MAG: helix-turn-helix transcriptional regulator [Clostridia bacterium]|nr:helix-turn-helix transcriptional regulator [Clostridia bacterium]
MDIFLINLKNLANIYTQKDIAEKTGFSASSIANYLSGKSQPSALFLLQLKKHYKIDIDQFLTTEIDVSNFNSKPSEASNKKYVGNYIVYYYNSSAYKGKVGSYNYDVLTFGIITVVDDIDFSSNKGIKSYGLFMLKRDQAEEYFNTLNSFEGDVKKIAEFYSSFENYYWGNLEQNSAQLFISLKNNTDKCMIILNNPPSTKKYIGGLGTVNSISRGREHVPCIQYILLSRAMFTIPDGEIYNILSLGLTEINIKNETNELINLIKKLYLNKTESGLTEYQQRHIVEDSIKNIIFDTIDSNMFRFAKVSNVEDDNYYRLIKDAEHD